MTPGTRLKKRPWWSVTLIGLVMAVALGLRLWGLAYDLPNVFHPDEPWPLNIAYGMLTTGDMNPHFFDWPSLVIYLNYFIQLVAGWLTGGISSLSAPVIFRGMGIAYSEVPGLVLAGRLVSVSAGVATVGVVIATGKRLQRGWGLPLLAGAFTAIVYTGVGLSRVITADIFAMLFISLVMLAAVDFVQTGRTRAYILAGIALGLTVGSKYNAGLAMVTIITAHYVRSTRSAQGASTFWRGFKDYRLCLAAVLALVAFIISTPYALLSFNEFWEAFRGTAQRYASGHVGMEGDSLHWYLSYMWQTGGILYLLALAEILRGLLIRSKTLITLSVFPLLYFIFISTFTVRNDRTLLPLTPFAFVLAASFLVFLWRKAGELRASPWRKLVLALVLGLMLVSLALPAIFTLRTNALWAEATSREQARMWIEQNLPPSTKIAYESYAPYIDPARYELTGLALMIDQDADWYREHGYAYLVFGSGMYARFFNDPTRYPGQVATYQSLFNAFELVETFADGLFEVRIYMVH